MNVVLSAGSLKRLCEQDKLLGLSADEMKSFDEANRFQWNDCVLVEDQLADMPIHIRPASAGGHGQTPTLLLSDVASPHEFAYPRIIEY